MPRDDGVGDRYRFGPLERRGLIAGWRGGQIAAVAVTLVIGVFALRSLPSATGLCVALGVVAAGVAVATWPVAGRTVEEWAPDALRHVAGRTGRRRRRGMPRVFASLRVLEARLEDSGGRGSVGVLCDPTARTFTVVLPASGPGFVLLGRDGQARRVQAWSGVLSSLSRQGGLVHRLQWVERSLPDAGAEIRRHFAGRRATPRPSAPTPRCSTASR